MALVSLATPGGKEVRVLAAAVEALQVEEWPAPGAEAKTRIVLASGTAIVVSGTIAATATALGL
jgi:hypothetical protein